MQYYYRVVNVLALASGEHDLDLVANPTQSFVIVGRHCYTYDRCMSTLLLCTQRHQRASGNEHAYLVRQSKPLSHIGSERPKTRENGP